MGRTDVVCMGAAIVDIPLQPVTREIFEVDSNPVEQIAMVIGGDAINEATIVRRLGHSVSLVAMVGDDAAGSHVLTHCDAEGIDRTFVKVKKDIDTSINVGLVTPDGERTFVTNRNGSLWRTTTADLDCAPFAGARLLSFASIFNNPLVDGTALVTIFRRARACGLTIAADMIYPRLGETLENVREALGYLDFFFPNRDEAAWLTGCEQLDDIADALLACGVKNVVIKNGAKGCFVKNVVRSFTVDAIHGVHAIDTIGAGDNFVAGFLTAVLDGRSLEGCAQFANAAGSLSVRAIGATGGVQNRAQVERERARAYR
ncbi:PfkB domain protein [Coriobacterium glomerans PW2]|uniref:PfkB domain protein n=1 Tax=Coriobacterium glomerans (strain ATCC 49209 / DSM 20642 / JCM 10262 / PW2) TaxID=700015 RepID=F2N8Z1_CORGP|nr:sugar kinase [Coriobacterium glomerans]AEB07591.1 PfkB domain protein [Coriobacterium glomerans PW2]